MTKKSTTNPRDKRLQWFLKALAAHNSDECLLWPFARRKAYGVIWYKNKRYGVHRLAYFFTYGKWPEPEGMHACDVALCFNPRHIEQGTRLENEQHSRERG